MLIKLLTKVFGSRNDRTLRRMRKAVNVINAMEPSMEKLSDDELKGKTAEFRARLEKGESLESLIPEAFAVVREASKRVFGMRHFDVQLLGGMVLNDRCIAEMRTGEGKTLTATLPAYLNALTGKSVKPTQPISPTAPTTNMALTICATTWRSVLKSACSANCTMRWWMKSTPF